MQGGDRGSGSKTTGRKWGVPQETEQTKDLSNQEVMSLQQRQMNDQDAILDILGSSIARTKEIAYAIGDETDEQLALLSDIDNKVDKTNAKVRNTTKRVERVERNSSAKFMWICICALLLSLIVVSVCAHYF